MMGPELPRDDTVTEVTDPIGERLSPYIHLHREEPIADAVAVIAEATQAIDAKHQALYGAPGEPSGDVMPGQDTGWYRKYTEGGIYWRKDLGAYQLYGPIYDKYNQLGGAESAFLGYPTMDASLNTDGLGRFAMFERGAIYWSPSTGAYEIHGQILDRWAAGESSWLGYPTSDEYGWDDGKSVKNVSDFENGRIFWTQISGAWSEPQWFVCERPNITFGSGLAIGGNCSLTVYSNGTSYFKGHFRDSGIVDYDFMVSCALFDFDHYALIFSHFGRTSGALGAGSRDYEWHEWNRNPELIPFWPRFREGPSDGVITHVSGVLTFEGVVEAWKKLWNGVFEGGVDGGLGSSPCQSVGDGEDDYNCNPYINTPGNDEDGLPPSRMRLAGS
jgi:uncharacterized protein with LGFP repeats